MLGSSGSALARGRRASSPAAAVRHDRAMGAYRGYKFVDASSGMMGGVLDAADVAAIEREFDADPVLKAAEREILSASAAQAQAAADRAQLLIHGREFDAMLGKLGFDHHNAAYARLAGSDDDDKASTQSVAHFYGTQTLDAASIRSYSPFPEAMDDAAENLLCDFGAPIIDGAIGLIDDEGAEIYVESNAPPLSAWMSNGNLCSLVAPEGHEPEWASHGGSGYHQLPAVVEFGVPGHTEVESIASLRSQYRALFGKDTNSNNRQWILRRLEAFRNGDEVSPPSSRLGSPHSGEDSVVHIGQTRFKQPSSPVSKRAAGKRQVKTSRSFDEDMDELESPVRGGRHAAGKTRMSGKGAKGLKRPAIEAALPKSPHKKAKSVSDAESNDGDMSKKGSARGAQKNAGRGKPGENGTGRRSKHHNPWALEEAEALVRGVAQCGGGKWADIKKLGFPAIEHRTAVDLKDKWRNLLRIAMLPQQSVKTVGDKKREIPQELLAKVRELAAKQAKMKAASGR